MYVRELMGGVVISCDAETTLAEAARLMRDEEVGSVVVMRNGLLQGLITERDLVGAIAQDANPRAVRVSVWMTPEPDTIEEDVDIEEAADWMLASGYRHLPVTSSAELVGVLSIKDVLWALARPRDGASPFSA